MALWDRMKSELDRAGRAAQQAVDEGRIRLELHRARHTLDRAAQRLGYATYHAQRDTRPLGPEELAGHVSRIAAAEAEVTRLDRELTEAIAQRKSIANALVPSDAPPMV